MELPEILIFSDGEKRLFKPNSFHGDNFVLQLLGLKQYGCELKLLETPVYRDLENNIIYFRDMLPLSSTRWDIYMNAVRYGDVIQEDLSELKAIINIFGGDPLVETSIRNMQKKVITDNKYLYPRKPEDDIYDLYIFKQATVGQLSWPSYAGYTITHSVDETISHPTTDSLYWIRTPRHLKTIS
jgi:hypothetical protein